MKLDYSERRCKAGDVAFIAQSPIGSWYEARTTFPLEECMNDTFLLNVRHGMRVGDLINITQYVNEKWGEVVATLPMARITAVDNQGVEMMFPFGITSNDKKAEAGIVVDRGISGQFVIRLDGAVVASRNTIVEANELATLMGSESGKPVKTMEEPARRGRPPNAQKAA